MNILPKLFAIQGEPRFVTDGCSGYMTWLWRFAFGKDPPWQGGCVIHDWYYWSGGSPINGRAAYQIRRAAHNERLFNHDGGGPKTTSPWHMRVFSRRDADAFLYRYVRDKGYRVWAWLIWIGVRFGGSQYYPFSWRWRYRHNYFDVLLGK